jgi:hypothetical protein
LRLQVIKTLSFIEDLFEFFVLLQLLVAWIFYFCLKFDFWFRFVLFILFFRLFCR